MLNAHNANDITKQERVISLFRFIEELNKSKQEVIVNISKYPKYFSIDDFLNDTENIHVFYRDRMTVGDMFNESPVLLSIHKAELHCCLEPDSVFEEWLEPGWDDFRKPCVVKESMARSVETSDGEVLRDSEDSEDGKDADPITEYFSDNEVRVSAYQLWAEKRAVWVEKQKLYMHTNELFRKLYEVVVDLDREAETMELIVADGFIKDKENPEINHPILTRRVKIYHNAEENTIYIEDTDVESELYTAIFQKMPDINLNAINHLNDDLHQNDYHPLNRNALSSFFKVFIHQLSADSEYIENDVSWVNQKKERLILYRNPCYILRKRMDGTLKAIEQIIENVERTGDVPNPIADIVEGGKIEILEDIGENSLEEQLAEVGGESVDILLSKEANKEQLEIARRLERYNAVLVQGPPGTGKTHTIANLMGHFMAQGKSVLVTSHTQKALTVLKEKIVSGLQDLCVSVLDDSNADMEKSIDGITEYMSRHNSLELKRKADDLELRRKRVIRELAAIRKKMFAIINRECNCIVYNGESISPSSAAAFVQQHADTLSYIPGFVHLYEPLPLSFSELAELYRSNEFISLQDEKELNSEIPNPATLLSPEEFERECAALHAAKNSLADVDSQYGWKIKLIFAKRKISIRTPFAQLLLDLPAVDSVMNLQKYISSMDNIEPWMQHCIVAGKKGGAYRQLWETLIQQIEQAKNYAGKMLIEQFGKKIDILKPGSELRPAMEQLRKKYAQKGKIGKLDLLFNKSLETALGGATINGEKPQSDADCDLILHEIEMENIRNKCAAYWNDLLPKYNVPMFEELDTKEPEQVAANYISLFKSYLNWYANEYAELKACVNSTGLDSEIIFSRNAQDTDISAIQKVLATAQTVLPVFCDVFAEAQKIMDARSVLQNNLLVLSESKCVGSAVYQNLVDACQREDSSAYRDSFLQLQTLYAKHDILRKREEYLKRLMPAAPQWAEAICKREGIHGSSTVPPDIEDAWRWKQYNGIIDEITGESFSDLQKKSLALSSRYREVTAKYAERLAWYHLLSRTELDIDIKQALIGWKQTVKKIGKGTGKNAPRLRAEARKLMVKCQNAVPGWIMPINKALESLSPKQNKFDVIIIDEASQSDISSLAILYMGRKLVIVGDDKQVSPMGVGTQIDKMNALQEMYISDKIPNAHLYDSKTSIYDIAATTFPPLMLREHFRCVPEIIGFSNWLSYDFKIKPLRDASNSKLLPAMINYRVADGYRLPNKTNPAEAKAIVALMRACMAQPEYDGKTFGVISLLCNEQVRLIQDEILNNIDAGICNERRILCGNASNFQGDERDVIFLSIVDCANGNGPVSKQGFGVDDAYRKRYNVAVSRARDQLWVIHSFDPANDLKTGDIRKMLLDYVSDPKSVKITNYAIEAKAESPFESAVAKHLAMRGYHLVQQWKVGAYRLDMVAVCGNSKVAIECDGERFHSGEDKIREDMERQTILERLGWRFIRIRGSEYYRNPEQTMERVISELTFYGIEPEASREHSECVDRDTNLLQRIKAKAFKLMNPDDKKEDKSDKDDKKDDRMNDKMNDRMNDRMNDNYNMETVAAALNPKECSMENLTDQRSKEKGRGLFSSARTSSSVSVDMPEHIDVMSEERKMTKAAVLDPVLRTMDNTSDNSKIEKPTVITKSRQQTAACQVGTDDITRFLKSVNVSYVDKRANGGSLWIIGGKELAGIVSKAEKMGYIFRFKKMGGKATKNQPAWWTR